jgi:hypothetical protein
MTNLSKNTKIVTRPFSSILKCLIFALITVAVYVVIDYLCGPFGPHCDPDCNYICRRNLGVIYNEITNVYPIISPNELKIEDITEILKKHQSNSCKYYWVANSMFYSDIPVLIICQAHKDSVISWRRGTAAYVLLANGDILFLESYKKCPVLVQYF